MQEIVCVKWQDVLSYFSWCDLQNQGNVLLTNKKETIFFLEWWDFGKCTSLDTVCLWIKSPGKRWHSGDKLSNNWDPTIGYRVYTLSEEMLPICEWIWAAFEILEMKSEMFLALLLVLHCVTKGEMPLTYYVPSDTWNKWAALITQWAHKGKEACLGLLEELMDWPKHRDFWGATQGITICSSPEI